MLLNRKGGHYEYDIAKWIEKGIEHHLGFCQIVVPVYIITFLQHTPIIQMIAGILSLPYTIWDYRERLPSFWCWESDQSLCSFRVILPQVSPLRRLPFYR